MKNMERRKLQLQKMMEESHGKLAKHHAGEELIEDEEREKMEKRIEIIERKLERMEDMDERVSAFRFVVISLFFTTVLYAGWRRQCFG